MATYRMSFRAGNGGPEMWPHCFELGVAAIAHPPLSGTDLSKHPPDEPSQLWPVAASPKSSLRLVAYAMRRGDVIYVKQGPMIVATGVVVGSYRFDPNRRIVDPFGVPWSHQVSVKWTSDFLPVRIKLGAEQNTVLRLTSEKARLLSAEIRLARRTAVRVAALEGELIVREAKFRSRNGALITAKKANSDFRCEACRMNFEEMYGPIGRGYIIAHHHRMIARGVAKTTLDGLTLICANCHAMVHKTDPPMSVFALRKRIESLDKNRRLHLTPR